MKFICGCRAAEPEFLDGIPSERKSKMSFNKQWRRMANKRYNAETSDDDASPGNTAILSEEELSANTPSDKVSVYSIKSPPRIKSSIEELSSQEDIQTLRGWRERFHKAFSLPKRLRSKSNSVLDDEERSVASERFSITTENKSVAKHYWNNTILFPEDEDDDRTRVSLMEFFAEKERAEAHPEAIDFADIDANESGSVVSGFLAVSFDDGCAQLEIQQNSTGGSTQSEDLSLNDFVNEEERLGATYPHPASTSSGSSIGSVLLKNSTFSTRNHIAEREQRDDREDVFSRITTTAECNESSSSEEETGMSTGWSFSEDDVSFASVFSKKKRPYWQNIPYLCGNLDDAPYDEQQDDNMFSVSSTLKRSRLPRTFLKHNL